MWILGFEKFGGPEVLAALDVPTPTAGEGQLVIEVAASGLNPADYKVRNGATPAYDVTFPMAVGREASGVVTEVGAGVDGFGVGDAVFGSPAPGVGTVGDYTVLAASSAAHVPAGLGWAEAASIPVSVATAYDAIDQIGLEPGQTLLVVGAGGGVGSAAVQFAAARGIRVIGAASEAKREVVEGLGATHVASGDGWTDKVLAAAGGQVDAVFDLVGFDVLREAATTLKSGGGASGPGGRLVSVASKDIVAELGGTDVTRRRTTDVYTAVAALAAGPDLEIQISATYPFDQAAEALAAVESGHSRGNVVVVRD